MPFESNPAYRQSHFFRLLIVDDMPQVREELRRLLELTDRVQVVGEAGNGKEAIRQAETLHPDVVLMDLEMPLVDGWEATREIKSRQLAERVVVLTMHVDPESTQRALQAGADAIVPKGTEFNNLLKAITHQTTGNKDKEWDR
jgi:DNA-binding NarL/FixJ family response regulator